jgi:outer membrane protein with beta-barrel domain
MDGGGTAYREVVMRRVLVAVAWVLALTAGTGSAQARVEVGVGGGVTNPIGDFGNAAKVGWHGRGSVAFLPAGAPVGLRIVGYYGQNGFDGGGGDWKLAGGVGELLLRLRAAGGIKPYVALGGGVYNVKAEPSGGPSTSDTKAAMTAAAGLGYSFTASTAVFFEARWVNVFVAGSDIAFIPLSAGLQFGLGH